jgi:beta-glucanase (GH16 family)
VRHNRLVAAIVVLSIALTTALFVPTQRDAHAAIGGLTWSDEFDGTTIDRTRWRFELGEIAGANNELQYYTDSTRNAALDGNGHLVITARRENPTGQLCRFGTPCEYTSARLITAGIFTQRYGRFEARMQVPRGQGLWPAFWLLGDNMPEVGWPAAGEIDVMENIGKEPRSVHASVHGPGYSGAEAPTGVTHTRADLAAGFHTFRVDWAPRLIVWYLDGVEYFRVTPANLSSDDRWVFDRPFYLLLNLAVGGNWPGNPDATTRFPQSLLVDYVRVWAYTEDDGVTEPGGID